MPSVPRLRCSAEAWTSTGTSDKGLKQCKLAAFLQPPLQRQAKPNDVRQAVREGGTTEAVSNRNAPQSSDTLDPRADADTAAESTSGTRNNDDAREHYQGHRAPQSVATLTDKTRVVMFMMKLHGKGQTRLPSKAVAQFPGIVPGNQKANLQKASRWWKERAQHTAKKRKSVVKVQCGVKKRMRLKAASGRGRKRAPWVEWLYSEMLGEFCRLRKTGVKLSRGCCIKLRFIY